MVYFDKTVKFVGEASIEELTEKLKEYGVEFVLNSSVPQKLEDLRLYYNNLTDEEFKQRLIDVGFEITERPSCYSPNDGVYPLCIGNNSEHCNECCLYENMIEEFIEE